MNENIRVTKPNMVDLDAAISASPLEHLERRVVALEQKVWVSSDLLANRNQNPPITKQ
jgi:hypothetical protein